MSEFDNPHSKGVFISTEPRLLNHTWITNALLGTYWGNQRTHETIVESIRNSLCFGVFTRNYADCEEGPVGCCDVQIGFARAITDYATFTEICDVVIEPKFRGKGFGRFLMEAMLNDARIKNTVMHLATRDAHAFYAKFGFNPVTRLRRNYY